MSTSGIDPTSVNDTTGIYALKKSMEVEQQQMAQMLQSAGMPDTLSPVQPKNIIDAAAGKIDVLA